MKFKKISALVLTFVMTASILVGCGGSKSNEVLNIYNVGDNIDEDILNNLANQRVEEKKNKIEAGQLDKIFGSQWNNRK